MLDQTPLTVQEFLKQDKHTKKIVKIFEKKKSLEKLTDIAVNAVIETVKPYYAEHGFQVNGSMYNILVEPLKNANFHGVSENGNVKFELFLSINGIVAGYQDDGEYFRRVGTKTAWEARIMNPEKHCTNVCGIGYGVGKILIFSAADLIHVDAYTGTLYTGLSINNRVFHKNG